MKFAERSYRDFTPDSRWISYRVKEHTTDLYIRASVDISGLIMDEVRRMRDEIEKHFDLQPAFRFSFSPVVKFETSSKTVKKMYAAADLADVGPMASVAGAIAEGAAAVLEKYSGEYIIENGGDLYMKLSAPASVSLYTENFHFKGRLSIEITPEMTPCGVCTSSAKTGPSFSYGRADAATVIHSDAASADALATALCGMVKTADDIEAALTFAADRGADGALIVIGDRLGAAGKITLTNPDD
jgi:hypothetical protein